MFLINSAVRAHHSPIKLYFCLSKAQQKRFFAYFSAIILYFCPSQQNETVFYASQSNKQHCFAIPAQQNSFFSLFQTKNRICTHPRQTQVDFFFNLSQVQQNSFFNYFRAIKLYFCPPQHNKTVILPIGHTHSYTTCILILSYTVQFKTRLKLY